MDITYLPLQSPQIQPYLAVSVLALSIWVIPWKGWALWRSARKGNKKWFVVLLILNTVGILEILYIFVFSKDRTSVAPSQTQEPPLL